MFLIRKNILFQTTMKRPIWLQSQNLVHFTNGDLGSSLNAQVDSLMLF